MFKKILLACAVIGLFCSSQAFAASGPMLDDAVKRGTLRVGFSTFVPWAMQDNNGDFIGFEIDVARKLADDLGLKIELVPTKWSGIIPALLTGQLDIIIGGMSVTPERNLKTNFTIPYDYAGMSLVANTAKAAGMSKLDDFNSENVSIAARTGGSGINALKARLPKAKILLFDEEPQAVQEVLSGRVHAFVSSAPLPAFQVLENPEKLFIPEGGKLFAKEPVGFAIRKNDFNTLNVLDNWIRRQESSGWLEDRRHYWFNTYDWKDKIR